MSEGLKEIMVLHQAWMQDPVTKMFLRALDKQEKKLSDFIAAKSTDANTSDAQIRHTAVQLKQTTYIKQTAYDPEILVTRSEQ